MIDFRGELKLLKEKQFIVSKVYSSTTTSNFNTALIAKVKHGGMSASYTYSLKTASGKESTITPKDLALKWNIGLTTATRTLQSTTRLCVQDSQNITLTCRFPHNDRMLRYNHLDTPMFSDTMFVAKRAGKSVTPQ